MTGPALPRALPALAAGLPRWFRPGRGVRLASGARTKNGWRWACHGSARFGSRGYVPAPPGRFGESIGMAASRAMRDGLLDKAFWDRLCREFYGRLKKQSPRNIALVLSALAHVRIRDRALLDSVSGSLNAGWLKRFNIQDLALTCNSYARLAHEAPRLFKLCSVELQRKLPDAGPQELALVANAFAKQHLYDAALFGQLTSLALNNVKACSPRHASNILHAFAKVDASELPLFQGLAGRLRAQDAADELVAIGVSHACFAAGRIAAKHPDSLHSDIRPLVMVLAQRLAAILSSTESRTVEASHLHVVAVTCFHTGVHSMQLLLMFAERLRALTAALSAHPGADAAPAEPAPHLHRRRAQLLDVVVAAAAVRACLGRAAVARWGEGATPTREEAGVMDATLQDALLALASSCAASPDGLESAWRLEAWDASLAAWFPDQWPRRWRRELLGDDADGGSPGAATAAEPGRRFRHRRFRGQ